MAQLGREPVLVDDFSTYVMQVKAYIHGHVVDRDGFPSTLMALLETDPSLAVGPPPIDISATGPRMVDFAAQIADGITFAVGADPVRLAALVTRVREVRREAGLSLDGLRLGCYVPAAVAPSGNIGKARDIIRGAVLRHARFSAFRGEPLDDVAVRDRDAIRVAFEVTSDDKRGIPKRADFSVADALPDDFVDRFAIVGDPARCAERFDEIIATGIDRLVVISRVPPTDPGEDNAARLAQEVFPLVGKG
jgi:5,10-methylenetetrahydromethanopterin reductase